MNKLDIQVKNIDYDPTNHRYTRASDGKLLAGVSSVSELVGGKDKNSALMQWAVNEAIDWVREHGDEEDELQNAKYAYKNKSGEAKDIGTDLHKILEEYISDGTKPVLEGFQKRAFDQFLGWEKGIEWLATEVLVGDAEELECAGRLDAIARIDGKLALVDFKVANTIGDSYFIQTAGYAELLRRMGIDIERRIILRLPKTEKRKVWTDGKPSFIENNLEAIEVKTPLEWEVEIFIKAREIYKYINRQK